MVDDITLVAEITPILSLASQPLPSPPIEGSGAIAYH